ncbi:MAG TPA: tripartite tricarboxylate transporter TctB family protein [Usitatibacter sp.]|nr:tripartite tricarboxylate transporter TctB family protein [Usitatibacter sp.]
MAKQRTVEVITLAVILAFSLLMMWDNWRTGMGWEETGPKPGYFPFYVALICGLAALYGLVKEIFFPPDPEEAFVLRGQFRRVMQVFVPTLAFVPATQWLGLYVASFILVAGFMIWIGRLKPWISIVTALVFSVAMFVTFEVAFDVIMPKGPLEHLLGY